MKTKIFDCSAEINKEISLALTYLTKVKQTLNWEKLEAYETFVIEVSSAKGLL